MNPRSQKCSRTSSGVRKNVRLRFTICDHESAKCKTPNKPQRNPNPTQILTSKFLKFGHIIHKSQQQLKPITAIPPTPSPIHSLQTYEYLACRDRFQHSNQDDGVQPTNIPPPPPSSATNLSVKRVRGCRH